MTSTTRAVAAADFLNAAARYLESVGLGNTHALFNGAGPVIHEPCYLDGALEVAAKPGRTDDPATARAAKEEAYRVLADYLADDTMRAGRLAVEGCPPHILDNARRHAVHVWSVQPCRTTHEAVTALREAAAHSC